MPPRKRSSKAEEPEVAESTTEAVIVATEEPKAKKAKVSTSATNGSDSKSGFSFYYFRKNCVTCGKAQSWLDKNPITCPVIRDATKDRVSPAEAVKLAAMCDVVYVAKGKNLLTFDVASGKYDQSELRAAIVGPSGFLRAPAVINNGKMMVGFVEEGMTKTFA